VTLFNGYHRQDASAPSRPSSWFRADTGYFLFNTGIDLMKNHYSGLMVVKPEGIDAHRVVFITEVGLKVFDMEFRPDSMVRVHYMMDVLNKKALVNTLSKDLSLLLMNGLSRMDAELYRKKDWPDMVYKVHEGKLKSYYHIHQGGERPYLAQQTGYLTNKVRVHFYGNEVTGIDSARIQHDHLKLSIVIYRINQVSGHAAE
jgi:hypothetical protein